MPQTSDSARSNKPDPQTGQASSGKKRFFQVVRWVLSCIFVSGALVAVFLSHVGKGPRNCTQKYDGTTKLVESTCTALSLTDAAPLLLLAALLLVPDFDELTTPFFSYKRRLKTLEEDVHAQKEVTRAAINMSTQAALSANPAPPAATLKVETLLQEAKRAGLTRAVTSVEPAALQGSQLFDQDPASLDREGKLRLFAALWNIVGPLTHLAENMENPNVWVSDGVVRVIRPEIDKLPSGPRLERNLVAWLQSYRALRNQGWFAANTLNDRTDADLSEAIAKARLLLRTAEQTVEAALGDSTSQESA